jgi:hypothetical protein
MVVDVLGREKLAEHGSPENRAPQNNPEVSKPDESVHTCSPTRS